MATTLPPEAVRMPNAMVAVLVAVIEQKHSSIRSVAEYAGCDPVSALKYLRRLRLLGLIAFEDHRVGTIRALVECVPVGTP